MAVRPSSGSRSDRPDIVLADIGMPERDGYEVAAFIKGDPQLAHIPVILLTGAFEPLDEERARRRRLRRRAGEAVRAANGDQPGAGSCSRAVVRSPRRSASAGRRRSRGRTSSATSSTPGSRRRPPPPIREDRRRARGLLRSARRGVRQHRRAGAAAPANRPSRTRTVRRDLRELQQPPPERTPGAGSDDQLGPGSDRRSRSGEAADLANAFAALLAAEQGDVVPQPARRPSPAPQRLGDDVIEDIVRR